MHLPGQRAETCRSTHGPFAALFKSQVPMQDSTVDVAD